MKQAGVSKNMSPIPESKKNHLWRKTVWYTDPEVYPLGPHHSAEVYCCEESNGYAVWYARRLAKDDSRNVSKTENGDYLLDYFASTKRDDAIEHAVLIANSDADVDQVIARLDALTRNAQKV
ncbi:hypothetical protein DBR37_05565 [Herminiimonas sp. KBW02]|nr:hypothetical protein DBR37_05565 [Herminiimonas sp. KBW02]